MLIVAKLDMTLTGISEIDDLVAGAFNLSHYPSVNRCLTGKRDTGLPLFSASSSLNHLHQAQPEPQGSRRSALTRPIGSPRRYDVSVEQVLGSADQL